MPICFDRKLLFVHIPKTAGLSTHDYFGFENNTKKLCGSVLNNSVDVRHLPLFAINELYDLTGYFKFCFIRNPWDRAVSSFKFCLLHPKRSPEKIELFEKTNNFQIFLESIKRNWDRIMNNRPSHYLCSHFHPQSYYIKSNFLKMNFIGKFENYNKDIKTLGEKFNIKKEIAHLNKTDHEPYRNLYNKNTIKIIEDLYKEDIENYNYKF